MHTKTSIWRRLMGLARSTPVRFPPPMSLSPYSPSAANVLVVDDNAGSQWHVCNLLARWGIQPQLAADGAEAVALARDNSFALILMDLQMPVMDGLAATQQIRQYECEQSYARAPIVVYTSRDVYAGDDLLRESGVDAVLSKPCDATTLRACLLRWCTPEIQPELALAHSS